MRKNIWFLINIFTVAFLLCFGHNIFAAQNPTEQIQVKGGRLWNSPDSTRIVFDISAPVDYKVFSLHDPERVVIDINNARVTKNVIPENLADSSIRHIRSARRNGNNLRIVLDMLNPRKKTNEIAAFLLTPNQSYGHRLVIDIVDPEKKEILSYFKPKVVPNLPDKKTPLLGKQTIPQYRDYVIAIDAGHGGEDPGAMGPGGTREKDVVLAIAKKLKARIAQEKGMRAFLVRKGDYYIPLRKRMKIARSQGADLFISIHADGFIDSRASGASVFTLSERGATSEAAKWLAQKENSADLIGGVSLDDKDDVLASVLLDLSQTASTKASNDLANYVLKSIGKMTKLHKNQVEKAGFAVLKSPDIPSILVETGFISNPRGERNLRSPNYQNKITTAIISGIHRYALSRPRPMVVNGTAYAKL